MPLERRRNETEGMAATEGLDRRTHQVVWIVRMECADYYCATEHIIAVRSSKELAESALRQALEQTYTPTGLAVTARDRRPVRRWVDGQVDEFEVDAVALVDA